MKKYSVIALLGALLLLAAFCPKKEMPFAVPEGWPAPLYDFKKNPADNNKRELGRMLFYDPVLSRDSTISCASCHLSYTSFTHTDHSLSHGIEGRIGTRNSPVLVNLAWSNSFMWDGAVGSLDEQSEKPVTHPMEMDETMERVIAKLQKQQRYRGLFYTAYKDSVIKKEYILKALGQFMVTMVSANAKYDKVKRGEDTFTVAEAKGYVLFKANCNSCHTEPLFTNNRFENNGLAVDETLNDIGRMKVTGKREDSLKFKVPTLRNIAISYPYMHDGRFKTLGMVLNNYAMGIQQTPTLNPLLRKGIYLSNIEKAEMAAFLQTLTDKDFLYNHDYDYPAQYFSSKQSEGK
jgi:cytochrome c peroxidase